jgi:hypothetical protein
MKIIRNNFLLLLAGIFLLAACAGSKATTGAPAGTNVAKAEDLSAFRPKFPEAPVPAGNNSAAETTPEVTIVPTNHVNNRVNALLDTVANANKTIRYAQGYRILAYTGTERKTAMDMRKAIIDRIPEERDYLQYKQPTFRLKIGDYLNRIEAQQVLSRIQDITPNAMIISEQINVNR